MTQYFEKIINFLNLPILQTSLWHNTYKEYLIALIALIAFIIIFKIIQSFVVFKLSSLAKKTKTDIDDTVIKVIDTLKPPFYLFLALYFALTFISIDDTAQKIIDTILIIWIVYQFIIAFQIIAEYVVSKVSSGEKDKDSKSAVQSLKIIIKIILWVTGGLLVLSNLGIDITSLIAGLGIGGIAVALAIQNILGDLFSSFAIYFDKPFKVGDFIVVGQNMGTVEKIGIKTTRLRALQGEEVVISNQELVSARIQNFKKMKERRIAFKFGVVYQTDNDKLKRIPQIIKDIIESVDKLRFDRTHFISFGPSDLTFEAVYFINSPEYNDYMDANQEVNLKMKEIFEKDGIEFAYPTQTIFLNK
ncbi:MAG: mechanosensitive ion channel protein MscS [Candidatus Liptonbacteria bacterium CG11_big_fil_rev_8_21_14_0_20_35_14]|uniref:Mechanosensitive ion channel protein MscS n=1 Tax=Candidatus Liptonbacteria bacterium CG11_big_fil_rev_8_21_14_0_20_35_14 TaxID=1974634 RepID=A0A2H0N6V6_9BACT|nr:MAG: mechanosensitive ion channel protein MscS [Candidatus Liptonbacteria bacterium CG11_big_fil_rev_8_21_14_0_20_35_14]